MYLSYIFYFKFYNLFFSLQFKKKKFCHVNKKRKRIKTNFLITFWMKNLCNCDLIVYFSLFFIILLFIVLIFFHCLGIFLTLGRAILFSHSEIEADNEGYSQPIKWKSKATFAHNSSLSTTTSSLGNQRLSNFLSIIHPT